MPAAAPSGVSLREVRVSDLPNFFEDQRDPAGARMAGFTPRDHAAFMAHWHKIMANPACAIRTVLFNGSIAGYMCAWTDSTERCVGYWIGREFWGRGVASAALVQFIQYEITRPLTARVVKHNAASIRVLQKAGFKPAGEEASEVSGGVRAEELVFRLWSVAEGGQLDLELGLLGREAGALD